MRQEKNRKTVIGVRLTTGAALVALLAGCSSIPDAVNPTTWFESDSPATAERRAAADSSYPNLSTVPERPTGGSTVEERRALRQGLMADRERARYTDDQPANVIQPGVEEKTTQRAPRSTAPVSAPAPAVTRQATPPVVEPQPTAKPEPAPVAAPVSAPVSAPEPAAPVVTQQPSVTSERTSGQVATTSRDTALPGRSGVETSDPAAPQPPA
ncbi:MAG: hypothetical protein KKB63_08525, partial [Alphaproteobacteria bacterium]|nr:hypothetical protein [Alphaproteobacteria bacterium]